MAAIAHTRIGSDKVHRWYSIGAMDRVDDLSLVFQDRNAGAALAIFTGSQQRDMQSPAAVRVRDFRRSCLAVRSMFL